MRTASDAARAAFFHFLLCRGISGRARGKRPYPIGLLALTNWTDPGGISFGGVVAFIFADLIILPILVIYRKHLRHTDDALHPGEPST